MATFSDEIPVPRTSDYFPENRLQIAFRKSARKHLQNGASWAGIGAGKPGALKTAQPTRIMVLGCRRWPCLQTVKSAPRGVFYKTGQIYPKNLRQPFLDPKFAAEAPWGVRSGVRGRRHGDIVVRGRIPFILGWSS